MTDEQLNRARRDDLLRIVRTLLPEVASLKAEVASLEEELRKAHGTHPDLAAGQHGATARRPGPNVQSQALVMHYHLGLPLRGAVTARKVSQCSKNPVGAANFEGMKSVTATLATCGRNVAKGLAAIIKGKLMPAPGR